MRVVFGECLFDRASRELTCRGAIVHAGPKLLGLLEVLLDARPRALTKAEIHQALWGATFVSEATLTSLVGELRAAIGDEARSPRFIRTVHAYGYVFIGDVTVEPMRGRDDGFAVASCRIIVGDRETVLAAGEHVLGRSGDATILIDDAGVSRHHARITIGARSATLLDLGSKNGTMLNGTAIEGPVELTDGAVIVLGATALKFKIVEAFGSTETVTAARSRTNL
ncbi:MAG TPA: FHA domain-containing protein [Vicinamibacterales bacterium]